MEPTVATSRPLPLRCSAHELPTARLARLDSHPAAMALSAAQTRLFTRLALLVAGLVALRWLFASDSSSGTSSSSGRPNLPNREIQAHNVIDRLRGDKSLDVHKHSFLQSRMGESSPSLAPPARGSRPRAELPAGCAHRRHDH